MLKILLTIVLPVLLPTLIFALYVWVENRRLAAAGAQPTSWVARAPWPWLLGGGVVLMVLSLAVLTGDRPVPPGHPRPAPHADR